MPVIRSTVATAPGRKAVHRKLLVLAIAAIFISLGAVGCPKFDCQNFSPLNFDSPKFDSQKFDSSLARGSSLGSNSAALAADDYSQGLSLFQARDYKNAAPLLRKAVFDRPGDANCFYYYALSCHYAKDFKAARIAYLEIINRYPSTEAASRAQKALLTLSPGLLDSVSASPKGQSSSGSRGTSSAGAVTSYGSSSGTSGDIIPVSSIVNFDLVDNHMVIDVAFNGRRMKGIFDTGAEMILMGKNHLTDLGLPLPTGETIARSRGVGGKIEDVWGQRMDVTVGGVTRKNIMVHIQEHMDTLPLLGLPFVKGMNYAVESNAIRFNAKSTGATASLATDYNSVPYAMQGHTMVVQAKVNGKDTAMCLDTGAAATLFTKAQATALGINVSDEPEVSLGSGVGGAITGRYTTLGSISLGPVQQRDFRIGVSDSNHSPYPLLGKDFWEGHRFSVDEDRHVIHFN
jgi:clan AA aspartic protease (TIGR02281 family)